MESYNINLCERDWDYFRVWLIQNNLNYKVEIEDEYIYKVEVFPTNKKEADEVEEYINNLMDI